MHFTRYRVPLAVLALYGIGIVLYLVAAGLTPSTAFGGYGAWDLAKSFAYSFRRRLSFNLRSRMCRSG